MKLRRRTALTTPLLTLLALLCLLPTAQAFHHPRLGRFVQRDPVGYTDGMSCYEYCRSNSVRRQDASGLVSNATRKRLCEEIVMLLTTRYYLEDDKLNMGNGAYGYAIALKLEPRLSIKCSCCQQEPLRRKPSVRGTYIRKSKTIHLCIDCPSNKGKNYLIKTLKHELVHAYDDARWDLDAVRDTAKTAKEKEGYCKLKAATEFRAYLAGGKSNWNAFDLTVRSVKNHRPCNEKGIKPKVKKMVEDTVEEMFGKSYKNLNRAEQIRIPPFAEPRYNDAGEFDDEQLRLLETFNNEGWTPDVYIERWQEARDVVDPDLHTNTRFVESIGGGNP